MNTFTNTHDVFVFLFELSVFVFVWVWSIYIRVWIHSSCIHAHPPLTPGYAYKDQDLPLSGVRHLALHNVTSPRHTSFPFVHWRKNLQDKKGHKETRPLNTHSSKKEQDGVAWSEGCGGMLCSHEGKGEREMIVLLESHEAPSRCRCPSPPPFPHTHRKVYAVFDLQRVCVTCHFPHFLTPTAPWLLPKHRRTHYLICTCLVTLPCLSLPSSIVK